MATGGEPSTGGDTGTGGEPPMEPDLILPTDHVRLEACVDRIMEHEKVALGLEEAQRRYWQRVMGQRMGRAPKPIKQLTMTLNPYGAAEAAQ